jgi:hypothetical protein
MESDYEAYQCPCKKVFEYAGTFNRHLKACQPDEVVRSLMKTKAKLDPTNLKERQRLAASQYR